MPVAGRAQLGREQVALVVFKGQTEGTSAPEALPFQKTLGSGALPDHKQHLPG